MMKSFNKPVPPEPNTANTKPAASKKKAGKAEDAQEVAGFLLSLKNQRSVSPDLNEAQDAAGAAEAPATQNPPMQMMPYGVPVMHLPYMAHPAYAYPYAPMGHPMPPPAGQPSAAAPKQKKSRAAPKEKKPRAPKGASVDPAAIAHEVSACVTIDEFKEYNFEELIEDSVLVQLKDRDLVPDALFVAMSQMKICHLTQADRVGCYKSRDLGFVGMCCKHCGGQPGFGRYFPNSVRSLAQTTTSQTILKHIGSKCRFCPTETRNAVLDLQRQQAVREGLATGRPRYGSRKIFFQRVWARLHAGTMGQTSDSAAAAAAAAAEEEEEECGESKSDETASLEEEQFSLSISNIVAAVAAAESPPEPAEEDEDDKDADADEKGSKRKSRFVALPIMSKTNKRVKISEVVVHNFKAV